jgi:hypothetical protein
VSKPAKALVARLEVVMIQVGSEVMKARSDQDRIRNSGSNSSIEADTIQGRAPSTPAGVGKMRSLMVKRLGIKAGAR